MSNNISSARSASKGGTLNHKQSIIDVDSDYEGDQDEQPYSGLVADRKRSSSLNISSSPLLSSKGISIPNTTSFQVSEEEEEQLEQLERKVVVVFRSSNICFSSPNV